jgi:hypothetical protein
MEEISKYSVIYVDIDGTLLIWPGQKSGRPPRRNEELYGVPPSVNEKLANALREWHKSGKSLVLWSRGGADHCRKAAKMCRLEPDACLPKPYATFDDAPNTVTRNERKGFVVLDPFTFEIAK